MKLLWKPIDVGDVIGMNEQEYSREMTVFPLGPQHPVLPEPVQLRFTVDGDRIIDVTPNIGYVHRGIERACELNDYKRNISLCERICGICNFMHAMCYCEAIERLTETNVPERAKYLRVIWSELSRLQSHLLWMGLFADSIGFESLFMQIWKVREIVLELNEETAGHRIHLSTCTIGGVRKDINEKLSNTYRSKLQELKKQLDSLAPIFKEKGVRERTVGKGLLPKEKATLLGAVGPVARGSGIPQDVRSIGYEVYGALDFEPVVRDEGDVYARTMVRLEETYQSIELINKALDQMPKGSILEKNTRFPKGTAISRVEQPRGEVFYYVVGNGTKILERCRVRTPTLANIPSLLSMLIGYDVADIPPIVLSVDPCISCTERITYIKERG